MAILLWQIHLDNTQSTALQPEFQNPEPNRRQQPRPLLARALQPRAKHHHPDISQTGDLAGVVVREDILLNQELGVAGLHSRLEIVEHDSCLLIGPVVEHVFEVVHPGSLNRLNLREEIIGDCVEAVILGQILNTADLVDHSGQILQHQFPRRIREPVLEGEQVVTATTANIDQQRSFGISAGIVEDSFAHGEPVTPVRPVGSLTFHEGVESGHGGGVLAKPGETVALGLVGILEGAGGWVIWVAVVGGLEILGGSLDQREDFKEPVSIVSASKFGLRKGENTLIPQRPPMSAESFPWKFRLVGIGRVLALPQCHWRRGVAASALNDHYSG